MCYCSVTILYHTFQFGLVFLLLFFPCDESVARLVQDAAISDTKGKHSPPHLVTKSRFVENLEYNLSFLASSLKSEFYHPVDPDKKSLSGLIYKDPWRLTKPPCCRWIAFLQTHWALIAFWHIIFIRWNSCHRGVRRPAQYGSKSSPVQKLTASNGCDNRQIRPPALWHCLVLERDDSQMISLTFVFLTFNSGKMQGAFKCRAYLNWLSCI